MSIKFEEVMGQPQAVRLLSQAIDKNRIAPAYLFVGPDGIGKRLSARYFVEYLASREDTPEHLARMRKRMEQGNHPDLLWVEPTYQHQGQLLSVTQAKAEGVKRKAPPRIRIEQVREISQFLSRPPLESPRSLVAIDRADLMAEGAANGLLKTLEEPGQATIIAIASSEAALLPTIVSRCTRIPFYRLSPETLAQVLRSRGYGEIVANPTVMALAQGSPGEAIAAFEQLQACPPELLQSLQNLPPTPREQLTLAKTIPQTLDTPTQLWLIGYLQQFYWQNHPSSQTLQPLEKASRALLNYVQPRLVWEVTLLAMASGQ
ncbi:MAG: DNA polymerase III subunit delta' [Roseofilum sp. SID2]|uniref:DNA polymerase III subunit delta' n=1 Tax=unclassified Roseofilum TaxID=2620099 RepID=UPI001AFFC1AF|nr:MULTISPECIES: DNA polymerase III subunit delta' [unclassified Roseofilum]MBP0014498.1 DNA polymerase III subunit delta' [Roseofilum sp. SID3]MBP0026552.1 DNA polymerase III subunit delta' [Roseofilum sp. SID2]MBP0039454.1 DNA polymerase III subunit delta' [Roseofilum sp. SID1]